MLQEQIQEARKQGYSDDEIIGFLESGKDTKIAGKVKEARRQGYPSNEIVRFLETGKGYTRLSAGGAAVSGAYKGVAKTIGWPADLVNQGLRKNVQIANEWSSILGVDKPELPPAPPPAADVLMRQAGRFGVRDYGEMSDLPPEERPIAAATEVASSGALLSMLPFAAGQVAQPAGLLAKELAMTFGAAQGAAGARLLAPESDWAQLAGEVVGGVASPTSLIAKISGPVSRQASRALQSLTRTGRETSASKALDEAIKATGEDKDAIIRALETKSLVPTTSGIKADSPTLIAIEKQLAKDTPGLARDITESTDEALTSLRLMTDELRRTGNPAALKVAAELQRRKFTNLINGRLSVAQGKAEAALASVPKDRQQNVSKEAARILDEAVADLRSYEKQLWQEVPRNVRAPPENIIGAWGELKRTVLRTENLDPDIAGFVQDYMPRRTKEGALITPKVEAWRVQRVKSIAGAAAEQARVRGDRDLARQYGMIEDAARADLENFIGDAADRARAFTKQFHDTVTRTYAGDAMALKSSGAQRTPDELLLDRAFGTGGDAADLRFRQLGDAAKMAGRELPMLDQQERFLATAAMAIRDPSTGRVNPKQLAQFMQDNAAVLERFPRVQGMLRDVETAERTLLETQSNMRQASKAVLERSAFSKILGVEDASVAVEQALVSKNPTKDFNQLAKVAMRGGDAGKNGLKASVLDYAERAAIKNGEFRFSEYETALFEPRVKGGLSPVELMKRHGIISQGEQTRLRQIIREGTKIERAMESRMAMEQVGGEVSALYDAVVRMAGARLGAHGPLSTMGGSIQSANIGSQYFKRLFEKVPLTRTKDILIEAAKDPQLMAKLLKKTASPREQKQIAQQLNAYLYAAGLTSEAEIDFGDVDWANVKEFARPKPMNTPQESNTRNGTVRELSDEEADRLYRSINTPRGAR